MHLSWLDPHKMRKMTVVGAEKMAVFDDMDLDRKVTVYDKAVEQATGTYGEWRTRTGDIWIPKIANDEPLRLECEHFLGLVRGKATDFRPRGTASRSSARSPSSSTRSSASAYDRARGRPMTEIAGTAIVSPNTVVGEDVRIEDGAVVGKRLLREAVDRGTGSPPRSRSAKAALSSPARSSSPARASAEA